MYDNTDEKDVYLNPNADEYVKIEVHRVLNGRALSTEILGDININQMRATMLASNIKFPKNPMSYNVGDLVEYKEPGWEASGTIEKSLYLRVSNVNDYRDAFLPPKNNGNDKFVDMIEKCIENIDVKSSVNKENDMKKLIKSDYGDDEYLTSSRKPIKSSYDDYDEDTQKYYGDFGFDIDDVVCYLYPQDPVLDPDDTILVNNNITKIGTYDFGNDGICQVLKGTFGDIIDFAEDQGYILHPDFIYYEGDLDLEDVEEIKLSRKPVKSGRYIKSGTSNFGSNDNVFGYSFPLVTYIAENYMYDEETDSETEERDYDADDWEYEDAIDNAKALADEMNIPQYDDYSEPYLCYEPFMIKFRDGYYEGLWIEVKEGTDETPYDENGEYQGDFDWKPFTEEQMNKYADKLNEYFNKLCSDYGWMKLGVSARFSNGETWYNRIDNSRKAIKSAYGKRPR